MLKKPGKLQAIAILCLVDGFLSISWGIGLALASIFSVVGILCLLPLTIYPIILGIVEIIYGLRLMADPVTLRHPPRFVAIMQIADIVLGDIVGLIVGVISLVFYEDAEVKAYFEQVRQVR